MWLFCVLCAFMAPAVLILKENNLRVDNERPKCAILFITKLNHGMTISQKCGKSPYSGQKSPDFCGFLYKINPADAKKGNFFQL